MSEVTLAEARLAQKALELTVELEDAKTAAREVEAPDEMRYVGGPLAQWIRGMRLPIARLALTLAASLARERALRAMLNEFVNGDTINDFAAAAKAFVEANALLAAPTDDTALREFGLRVAIRHGCEDRDAALASVDSVLKAFHAPR